MLKEERGIKQREEGKKNLLLLLLPQPATEQLT